MADTMLKIERQEAIERRYSKFHIDQYIKEEIDACEDMQEKIVQGAEMLRQWASQEGFFPKKRARLDALLAMDLEALVRKVFIGVAYCYEPTTFTNITGQLAGRLGMEDKRDSIQTIGEVLVVLAATDAFDIEKPDRMASLYVVSRIPLSEETQKHIFNSAYLPPMVCEPLEIRHNRESGYLSHKDSLILGQGNHHEGDICLDVINLVNKVPLRLATDFLSKVEEDPNTEYTIEKAIESALKKGRVINEARARVIVEQQKSHWRKFKQQGYEFYSMMVRMGNEYFLTHAVDKRGRLYCRGFHISSQGSAFKKASIELAREEVVEDVPDHCRI